MRKWLMLVAIGLMMLTGGCAKKQQEIPNEETITTPTTNDPPLPEQKPAGDTTANEGTK